MTLTKYVRARSLAAALTLCAGVALSVVTAAGSSAIAQELEWAKQAGASDDNGGFAEQGNGIATDRPGNSYVIGVFTGTAIFGEGEANETVLTSHPGQLFGGATNDIFLAKYNPKGLLVWAKRAGGGAEFPSAVEQGFSIAADGRGNSYATGGIAGTATFGEGEDNETVLEGFNDDIFIAKYDRKGLLVWAKPVAADSLPAEGHGIAIDGPGNSYVTGVLTGTATFGEGEANETVLTSHVADPIGGRKTPDIFVAKYDRDGRLLWAKRAGGSGGEFGGEEGNGIATDRSGTSYVTGSFDVGLATFGEGEANETVLTGKGIFVAKYDRDGKFLWVKQANDADGFARGSGIAIDGRGDSYVTGTFSDTATFGGDEANETVLTSHHSAMIGFTPDIFIAKYDRDGRLLWAKRAGGCDAGVGGRSDEGNGIATDGRGDSYVTGSFSGTATFGEGEANETELSAEGIDDIFVAKYDRNGLLVWGTRAGSKDLDAGLGIATDSRGDSNVTGSFSGTATFGEGKANETELSAEGSSDIFVAKYGSRPKGRGAVARR